MTNKIGLWAVAAVLATLPACAATKPSTGVQSALQTVEVKVPTPVPCKALAKLGQEPAYVDSGTALRTAADIFEQVKLLLAGRAQRAQRLEEYKAARAACE